MLRDYQQNAFDATISWFKYKNTPAIVVIATGGGKSHVIASLAEHYAGNGERVLIVAHRKELLEQTGEKITHPIGFYSASIGEKDISKAITIGQIQSIYDVAGQWQVILVDECHMMPNNDEQGQYWNLVKLNPKAKVVGLTATPFRLKGGKLNWGEIIYEANYPALHDAGHLATISNKLPKDLQPDLSKVDVRLGEYVESQLAAVMEEPALVEAAIRCIVAYSENRHSCLVFCVSVNHAKLIALGLRNSGHDAVMVSGDTLPNERAEAIKQFKHEFGNIKFLVNCEIFLVGFDAPNVDAVFCIRPTKSKALWEQMMGRGVRKAEGKANCLLVDMAGNLEEHGIIGSPYTEKARKEKAENKGKICPECEEYVKPTARKCDDCGYDFPEAERPKVSHNYEADMGNYTAQTILRYEVWGIEYKHHVSKKGNESLMVKYKCAHGKYQNVAEWLPRWKIAKWFKERGNEIGNPDEYSWDDLLYHTQSLKVPSFITIDAAKEFVEIISYEWPTTSSQLSLEDMLGEDIL